MIFGGHGVMSKVRRRGGLKELHSTLCDVLENFSGLFLQYVVYCCDVVVFQVRQFVDELLYKNHVNPAT